MSKKYKQREYWIYRSICECSHVDQSHENTKMGWSWCTGECRVCMCPKYKFEKEYKEESFPYKQI